MSLITEYKKYRKLLAIQQVEEEDKKKQELIKQEEENELKEEKALNMTVIIRGTNKIVLINKSEYDPSIHICL